MSGLLPPAHPVVPDMDEEREGGGGRRGAGRKGGGKRRDQEQDRRQSQENQNRRNASALSKGQTSLLVIYKPDIEEMIERYPLIGAKFLQSVSVIVAQRFERVTNEIRILKEKVRLLERKLNDKDA